jgi:ribosome-binding protein aMBF1 (putative translation factor)
MQPHNRMVNSPARRPHGRPTVTEYEPRRDLDPDVAAMLRRYRTGRGWSYRRAGRETGVSFGMIAMLEAGTRVPSTVTAEALIRCYRMTPGDAAALRSVALEGVGRDWSQR